MQQVGIDSTLPDGPETRRTIMSTATLRYSGPLAETKTAARTAPAAPRKSLLARFVNAMIEARMRAAARELALHRHLLPENSPDTTDSAFTTDGRLVR